MNSQVNYIINAGLILSVCAGVFCFVKKVPVVVTDQENTEWCGTKSASPGVTLSASAFQGKTLFMSKCASCHALFKDMTGPGLLGFTDRDPWTIRQNVYDWIRNPTAFMKKNEYSRELGKQYGGMMMTAFPDMTNEEIDAICDYIGQSDKGMSDRPVASK